MDVRRLLAHLSSGLAAVRRLFAAPVRSARVPVAVAPSAPRQASASSGGVRPQSPHNWLEDGRRLRLRRPPITALRPGGSVRHAAGSRPNVAHVTRAGIGPDAPAAPGRQSLPPASTATPGLARPGHATSAPGVPDLAANVTGMPGEPPLPSVLAPTPAPPSAALPPDIRVEFASELSAETLAAIESLDPTQRRLIFLRYLVRQGVYNEGFGGRRLPEQYWHSRGLHEHGGESDAN